MNKNSLLIIDLTKNYQLKKINKTYIKLNNGNINLINCKQLNLKNFSKFRLNIYKKLIRKFKDLISRNQNQKFFLSEMEIFNLRNDRYIFPDRVLNFLIVKKILLQKKIKKIEIISDNKSTLEIFDNLNLEIKKNDLSKSKSTFNYKFPKIKILKFLVKILIFTFIIGFKKKINKSYRKKNNFYFSLYPNKFFYDKENFFEREKNLCNFLITDETHLNYGLKELLNYKKITENKKIINIENYIYLSDILILLFKNLFFHKYFKIIKKFNFNFSGLNLTNELEGALISSYINRSKLEIYSKAIPRFLKFNNVSSLSLYLFEYCFGFFLMRNIRNFSKKIKIYGFQHGIFSNNLMWLDVINSLSYKNTYKPDHIYCQNKFNIKDYKTRYKKIKISLIKKKEINQSNNSFINKIKIKKRSKKILVLPGLHDTKDIYFYIQDKIKSDKKNIFYFKLHPKGKFFFPSQKRLKKIMKFDNHTFSKVIISQTSSLHYEFLKSNRDFSVIDFDYKQNHVSSFLRNNKKISFLK